MSEIRRAVSAAAAALGLALTVAPEATAQPGLSAIPAPLVKVEGLKQVSPHVHVIPDNSAPGVPNVGFVVGSKGVLAIDTGLGGKNGAAVAAVAAKLGPGRTLYLVATHAHPEHDLGAHAFPAGTRMIRSRDQTADRDADLQGAQIFAARSPAMADLLAGAEFRAADVSFDREYDLDLGGVQVRIMAFGPNHTDGDTVIWIPADKVLFSGDLAMRPLPVVTTAKASVARWLGTLDRLEGFKPQVVVPSHGPIGDVTFVRDYRTYLKEVAQRTATAKAQGQSLDAATATVSAAMAARYPDSAPRIATAVRMAYAEGS